MSGLNGLSRPMRIAGVALIGLAVIAGVVGTAVALSGGDSTPVAAPTSASAAPSTGNMESTTPLATSTPPAASATTTPSASSAAAPSSTVPAQQPPVQSSQAPPAANDNAQSAAKWVTVRIYNNSTITGLAARAGDELSNQGWTVAEVSNYSAGVIPTTTAYFRPGTDEETAAKALAASFGMRVAPRFDGIEKANPGVIVIVTNDYKSSTKSK